MHKRLRVETPDAQNTTVPAISPAVHPIVAEQGEASAVGSAPPSAEQKVRLVLERSSQQSFCEELGITLSESEPDGLWQWFCASLLISARIKSSAGLAAGRALFCAGLTSAQRMCGVSKEHCASVLREAGYDRYDDKAATFLVEDAKALVDEHGGDLNRLREATRRNPVQERTLLKKYRGIGDGALDIFFREVQLAWEELYPFADKKALKAARLVGLPGSPQTLAAVCGDRQRYVRLIAALVRIELSKTHHEY